MSQTPTFPQTDLIEISTCPPHVDANIPLVCPTLVVKPTRICNVVNLVNNRARSVFAHFEPTTNVTNSKVPTNRLNCDAHVPSSREFDGWFAQPLSSILQEIQIWRFESTKKGDPTLFVSSPRRMSQTRMFHEPD